MKSSKKLLTDELMDELEEEWMKLVQCGNCLEDFQKYFADLSPEEWMKRRNWDEVRWSMKMIKNNLDEISIQIGDKKRAFDIIKVAAEEMIHMCKKYSKKEDCWEQFEIYWDEILKSSTKSVTKEDLKLIREWLLAKTNTEIANYADEGNENKWIKDLETYLVHLDNPAVVVKDWNQKLYYFLYKHCSKTMTRVRENFKTPYVDPFHNVKLLENYVTKCEEEYDVKGGTYIAPYIWICQSSGFGKSRMITEFALSHPVLYISLLGRDSKEYPPRTSGIKKLIFPAEAYRKNDGILNNRFNLGIKEKMLCNAARMSLHLFHQNGRHSVPYDQVDTTFTKDAINKFAKEPRCSYSDTIYVVIDEARELLQDIDGQPINYYRLFRHVLSENWNKHRMFGILIDAQPHFAHFSGPTKFDPSAKDTLTKSRLFQPFILMGTLDIKKFENTWGEKTDTKENYLLAWKYLRSPIKDIIWQDIAYLNKLGRPMWENALIQIAQDKFFALQEEYRFTYETCLAILCCRLGGLFAPSSKIGPALVANHMATLLDVDITRESILCGYISDPFLANAAIDFWQKENGHVLSNIFLPALRTAVLEGVVSQGFLGEYVARIILLLLIDKLRRNLEDQFRNEQGWVDVEQFLLEFYPENAKGNTYIKRITPPQGAKVGFCHFVMASVDMEKDTIAFYGQRRAAVMLKPRHPGADILIPYWYFNEVESVVWSYILVQVENHQTCPEKKEVQNRLHPESAFSQISNFKKDFDHSKVIGICMCLGCNKNCTSIEYAELLQTAAADEKNKPAKTPEFKKSKRSRRNKQVSESKIGAASTLAQKSDQTQRPAITNTKNFEERKVPTIWRCGVEYCYGLTKFKVDALRSLLYCPLTVKKWQSISYERSKHIDTRAIMVNPKRTGNCKIQTVDFYGRTDKDMDEYFKQYNVYPTTNK